MDLGDTICDMHDWFPDSIEVTHHVTVETESAFEMLTVLCESLGIQAPHNKFAVCVGETLQGSYKAAYSYDGRRFGLFTFKTK
jgi:hypothetical protein